MARNALAVSAMLVAAVFLSGCGLAVMEAGSTMVSDKTASDHVISLASGKDCSWVRKEKGLTYCKEDALPNPKPEMYCYRNLGNVTCYEDPLPYGRYQPIDSNEHNIPPERR